jgi:hypothetical protein
MPRCCLAHQVSANLHTQFEQTRKKLERGAMDIKDEEAKQGLCSAAENRELTVQPRRLRASRSISTS